VSRTPTIYPSAARARRSAEPLPAPGPIRTAKRAILAAIVIGGLWGFAASPYFRVERIKVAQVDSATEAYIAAFVKLPPDATTLTYPLSWVAGAAERCPLVAAAAATRRLPRTILLSVRLREPMCAISESGGCLVIDTQGAAFRRCEERPATVPLALGIAPPPAQFGDRIHPWYTWCLYSLVRAGQESGLNEDYVINLENLHAITLHTARRVECKIGEADNLERKMRLFSGILADAAGSGAQVAYVDVRDPDRPVWKPRGSMPAASEPAPSKPKPSATATKAAAHLAKPKPAKPKSAKPKAAPRKPLDDQ